MEHFGPGEEIFRLFLPMFELTHPLISTGVGWQGKLVNPRSNYLFCVVYFSCCLNFLLPIFPHTQSASYSYKFDNT